MKNIEFDQFKTVILPEIAALLKELQKDIDDDYRTSNDDDMPSMQVTIALDDNLDRWTYQTGDTSYMGNCYHYPYWGSGTLTRDCNCEKLADELIESVAEAIAGQFQFED